MSRRHETHGDLRCINLRGTNNHPPLGITLLCKICLNLERRTMTIPPGAGACHDDVKRVHTCRASHCGGVMIEDMTIRKSAPKTQHDYVLSIKNLAAFLGRSHDTASFEDVRRYQLHLAASGAGEKLASGAISSSAGLRPFRPVRRRKETA